MLQFMMDTDDYGLGDESEINDKREHRQDEIDVLSCCNIPNKNQHLLGSSFSHTTLSSSTSNYSTKSSLSLALE
jgi:hypothetical protein